MRMKLLMTLLLLAEFVFGQTEKHSKVLGTKCSMIAPSGFIVASNFSGFMNVASGASIMINEIPTAYQTMADGFTADAMKTKGITLLSKETIDFNNAKGTLIYGSQAANGIIYLKQILLFGDKNGTVIVNGIYPEALKDIEPEIKNALLSTVYDASAKENLQDAVKFTLEIENTDFKLVKYMAGSALYSIDSKIPTEKPIFIVNNSIMKIEVENKKKYSEERLKSMPGGEQSEIKEINEVSIDGLKGYEIVADNKTKNGKLELVYQVMLFNDSKDYYLIVGKAQEEFEKNLKVFKKIAKSFKRK